MHRLRVGGGTGRVGAFALPRPEHYGLAPVLAPLIGGVVGAGAYQLLIHPFLPAGVKAKKEPEACIDGH